MGKIEEMTEALNKELEFDLTNLDRVLVRLPMLYNNYLQEWYHTARVIDKLEIEMSNMYTELYGYYKVSYDFDLTNAEIKTFIENNVDRNKIKANLLTAKTYVTFLEKSMENINNARWSIKSLIDYENFKSGSR